MKNITNNFNEIIINKTLSSSHLLPVKSVNNEFSSFLEDNSKENKEQEEETLELTQSQEQEESSPYTISQQVELQNTSYLNKIFLFSVA